MFGYYIQDGDWVAFGRRDGNTSTMAVYQFIDGKFHPRFKPGVKNWWAKSPQEQEESGHGWPLKKTGPPQSSLDPTNCINLSRVTPVDLEEIWEDMNAK